MPEMPPLPADYAAWLAELKARIHSAQQRASLAVNRECFAETWPDGEYVQKVLAQLTWYHQLALLKHGATKVPQVVALFRRSSYWPVSRMPLNHKKQIIGSRWLWMSTVE